MAELLQQLVTRQAELNPDAVALVMNDERISYATLEDASNQLAWPSRTSSRRATSRR
jgi:non-ribosomal peptide synthetase component E (peptide arylation enzyme)